MPLTSDPDTVLAEFVANLSYEKLPEDVIQATKLLFIDWLGSVLAGASTRQAKTIQHFAAQMGADGGGCTDFVSGEDCSAYFAAMSNAAASHVVEQDDLHNSSVLHPATVVFSALVAAAEDGTYSGKQVIAAAVAGYEVGIRVGEFLGRSHYVHFHTTGTAGTLAAAAAVSNLIGLDSHQVGHAFGSSGTMAAGLWEFLTDGADSKQLHVAHASANGLMSAYLARDGFMGARQIFTGAHGLGQAMSTDADNDCLTEGLGVRWATNETSYKWHASCRHTHPAADALQTIVRENELGSDDIRSITAHVHQAAIDVLGPVVRPQTVHQAKFSMATVLGLLAVHGSAGLREFDEHALSDPHVLRFLDLVKMEYDPKIDAAYPHRWMARVVVTTNDGRELMAFVEEPKGDPGNPLSPEMIVEKAISLGHYSGLLSESVFRRWIDDLLVLEDIAHFSDIFKRK